MASFLLSIRLQIWYQLVASILVVLAFIIPKSSLYPFFDALPGSVEIGCTLTVPDLNTYQTRKRKEARHAYAFLVGGCDPKEPSYRYFIYDLLIAAHLLREDGSKADIIAFIQMAPTAQGGKLADEEIRWLETMNIKIYYNPMSVGFNRYSVMMEKFRILSHTEYSRILFMDADVLPLGSLDYIFDLSERGVLKENLIVPGVQTPANGGFFMLAPYDTALQDVHDILKKKEQRESTANDADSLFDPVMGWGHQIQPPDKWVKVNGSGTLWNFLAAYADQGLLYHYAKYFRKHVSIVLSDTVQNWGPSGPNGTVALQETLHNPFLHSPRPKYRGLVDNCWRWDTNGCHPPMSDYQHWVGQRKPWMKGPPGNITRATRAESAEHLWFFTLSELNDKLSMGLDEDLKNWPTTHTPWKPPVGFRLLPDHQQGVQTMLLQE